MKDNLSNCMKENYENKAKTRLLRRTPVIIRLDGKAFHTFTKSFDKPFDKILTKVMQQTMLSLCKKVQGCVLGVHYKVWLKGALFDARCFNISKEEVTNCILW